jgi:hypothetical protein
MLRRFAYKQTKRQVCQYVVNRAKTGIEPNPETSGVPDILQTIRSAQHVQYNVGVMLLQTFRPLLRTADLD